MVDEEGESLAELPLAIDFEECSQDDAGIKLLGKSSNGEVTKEFNDYINLLQLATNELLGLDLKKEGLINIFVKPSDIQYGNWKITRTNFFY